ncbi:MAG: acetyl-CoA carboxylase biotin carboxyl carrier protein subunit [Catonella sp.]|nr:acetyl-CoA carboxylase biotin carboxyl carrier protein subunit [Catonella sp.]MDY6355827.1 acetyl-CoA carboxylase biotin carboxyl carrier protein subunit [Catonella sp.]
MEEKKENGSFAAVKEAYELFRESDLSTMKAEFDGISVEFSRSYPPNCDLIVDKRGNNEPSGGQTVDNSQSEKSFKVDTEVSNTLVNAPLAGIFYRSAKPGDKPFVEEGSTVKKGDTLGLIEAMKMVNDIVSPCDGVIEKIKADDGKFTEFGAALFEIKKAGE